MRASQPADLQHPPLDLGAGVMSPLDLTYAGYSVQLKPEGDNRTQLILKYRNSPQLEIRILVDTTRHVILKIEHVNESKVNVTTTFDDFVEIAGAWYAGRIESYDADGRRTSVTTQEVQPLAGRRVRSALEAGPGHPRSERNCSASRCPGWPMPRRPWLPAKAAFEDQIVMLLHFQATQQWDRVLGHLAEAEKLSGKPGMRWVRLAILPIARKAEEAKKRYFEEAELLAQASRWDQRACERRPTKNRLRWAGIAARAGPTLRPGRRPSTGDTYSWPTTSSTPPASLRPTSNCGCWTPCGRSMSVSRPMSWP